MDYFPLNDYQQLAMRTAKDFGSLEKNIYHAVLGVAGEVLELSQNYRKVPTHVSGKSWDDTNVIEELGDINWFIALYFNHTGRDWYAEYMSREDQPNWIDYNNLIIDLDKVASSMVDRMKRSFIYGKEFKAEDYYEDFVKALTLTHKIAWGEMQHASLDKICIFNINKLKARYGDKYSDYAALNRNVSAEIAAATA